MSQRAGNSVVAVDIRELHPDIRVHCDNAFVGDICDHSLLERLLAMYEVDEVFHLAALLSTRGEFAPETAHQVNVVGTLNLLKLAAEQARSHGRSVKFISKLHRRLWLTIIGGKTARQERERRSIS